MRTTVYVVLALLACLSCAAMIPDARGQQAAKPSGSWSSSNSKLGSWNSDPNDPLAGNPEAAKLHETELQAAREAQSLINQLPQASTDSARADLKTNLRAALVRQFDAQQKRRSMEIASIEERLTKYKETLKKRDTAKDTIVDRRLDELMGLGDELGWEETVGASKASRGRSGPPALGSPPAPPSAAPLRSNSPPAPPALPGPSLPSNPPLPPPALPLP